MTDSLHTSALWSPGQSGKRHEHTEFAELLLRTSTPFGAVAYNDRAYPITGGTIAWNSVSKQAGEGFPLLAWVPALPPKQLGDSTFRASHGVELCYMAGSMANGIASTDLVIAMSRAGMLASFGAAGLRINEIEGALQTLRKILVDKPWASNLIFTPNETGHEEAVVDLYLRLKLRLVEASAYLSLTLPTVRYRVTGIGRDPNGTIVAPNKIIAKASRVEVAEKWLSPPPDDMLKHLAAQGEITLEQAELASQIPMAEDLTAEADSGGHTDNRPAIALIPTLIALRNRVQAQFQYAQTPRIGAAGGIATPESAAAVFAMGAAYIVTGTINQGCCEAGTSSQVRKMLSEAGQADVTMAPAVDMFEMGVKLQTLKRGTLFAMRGNLLWELYREYGSLEELPAKSRKRLENEIFRMDLKQVWEETRLFFNARDLNQVRRAETDAHHKMALVFRWYLGLSSRWANTGVANRQADYQIWAGPAIGAFNEWTRGSPLAIPDNRKVADIARKLMCGAAVQLRINSLKQQGVTLSAEDKLVTPQALGQNETSIA
ncbi:MAG: PfaD family polyunsaturated fatty acid/polyketide biosynthesis protein [Candidatus Eutrophobiaceae bacterium]